MKIRTIAGALSAAVIVALGSASAQDESSMAVSGERVVVETIALDREAMIEIILGTWDGSEYAVAGEGRLWRDAMRPVLEGADEANLRRAMDALEFPVMLAALQGKADGSKVAPSALGDPSSDLVYTPIEPCRILDTRLTSGPIPAESFRSFDGSPFDNGSFAFQGGDDSDCGIPATRPSAVMLNITAVNPLGAGYLTAYPWGSDVPLAASLNYASGAIIGNEVLVTMNPAGLFDFRIYTFSEAHVVADAVGYFMAPEATALECEEVRVEDVVIAAGGRRFETMTCPAGFIAVGGGVFSPLNAGMRVEGSGPSPEGMDAWFASIANDNATQRTSTFSTRCCRIPGR